MSRPHFLADNDLNDAIDRGVTRREPALEFARVRDFGLDRAPDREVLQFAAREHWTVVSHDINSMTAAATEVLAAGEPMCGLLLVHQREPIGPTIDSLVLIWSESGAEEWVGLIEFLPP